MPNPRGGGWGQRGGSERTIVNKESQVGIPLSIVKWMAIVGDCIILIGTFIKWCLELRGWLHAGGTFLPAFEKQWKTWHWIHEGAWLTQVWYPRFRVNWPLLVVALIAWSSIPLLLLLLRFGLEMWNRHYPATFTQADPANGLQGPIWAIVQSFKALRGTGARRPAMRERYAKEFGKEDE
jgi:hypothetical protein